MHVTYVVFIPAQSDSIFILFHPCRISCHGDAPAGGPTTMWINGWFSTSNYARSSLWIARCDAPNASNWRIIFFQVPESMKNERAFTTQYPFVSVKNPWCILKMLEIQAISVLPLLPGGSQPVNPIVCKKKTVDSVKSGEAVKVDERHVLQAFVCVLFFQLKHAVKKGWKRHEWLNAVNAWRHE